MALVWTNSEALSVVANGKMEALCVIFGDFKSFAFSCPIVRSGYYWQNKEKEIEKSREENSNNNKKEQKSS